MGRIFDIQRFSIQDGPGIRTTVFLKGCPLHCKWCHNPESISPKPQLSYLPDKCISCGECFKVCTPAALVHSQAGKPVVDRPQCTDCGACPPVCDAKALEMVGREATVEEVMDTVMRDREYYRASGGGMTLSGGEPLFQPEFAEALLRAAKARGLHCCVETSGFTEWKTLERIYPLVDLFLFDWKETNPQLHESFTGQTNKPIRENLAGLHRAGAKILLRCPMIPEYNARKEHLDGIAAIATEMPNLQGVELLPYHRLGMAKLRRFGLPQRMPESVKAPDRKTLDSWVDYLKSKRIRVANADSKPAG
jgi:glycyl-radical enzyme activating protein